MSVLISEDSGGFAAWRARVHDDEQLARELAAIPPERFIEVLVARAAELGFTVSAEDLAEAVAQGRRAWLRRWIE